MFGELLDEMALPADLAGWLKSKTGQAAGKALQALSDVVSGGIFRPAFFVGRARRSRLSRPLRRLRGLRAPVGLLKMRSRGFAGGTVPYGVVCVAQDGRAVMAEAVGIPGVENGAELKRRAEGRAYPLGESSLAAVTFAAVKMSDAGKLDFKWTVSDRFSLFSPPKGAEKSASFENMLCMRAGFNPSDAKLFPDSSEPRICSNFPPNAFPVERARGESIRQYAPLSQDMRSATKTPSFKKTSKNLLRRS